MNNGNGRVGRDQLEAVKRALENPKYRWRTIDGVARETHLAEPVITDAMRELGSVISTKKRIDRRGKKWVPLYTTRDHFIQCASFGEKLKGAFQYRLF